MADDKKLIEDRRRLIEDRRRLIEDRRKLLIPATFGVHSKIEGDLGDYISRTFGHSTFAFYEAFLDCPAQWWENFAKVKEAETGTTEPFLSRFVHKSGLTPKVDELSLQKIAGDLRRNVVVPLKKLWSTAVKQKKIAKNEAKNAQSKTIERQIEYLAKKRANPKALKLIKDNAERLNSRVLELPLIATKNADYHKNLEKLEFSLNDSIILRGLLQVWLAIENGGAFRLRQCRVRNSNSPSAPWSPVEGWDEGVFDKRPLAVTVPVAGSTSCVSVIGRLDPKKIKKFYGTKVLTYLQGSTGRDSATINKALDLLREYQIALRPWIGDPHSNPFWIGISISSDAIFWGECVVLLPGVKGELSPDALKDYEGVANILSENVQRTFMPIMTIFETYLLEHQLGKNWDTWQKSESWKEMQEWEKLQSSSASIDFPPNFLSLGVNWSNKENYLNALKLVGMGYEPNGPEVKSLKITIDDQGAGDDHDQEVSGAHDQLFLSMLYNCLDNDNWITKLNELERSLASLWAARFHIIFKSRPRNTGEMDQFLMAMRKIENSLVFEKYLFSSPAVLKAIMVAIGLRHGDRGNGKPSVKTALVVGGPGSGKESMAKIVRLFSPGYRFGELITLNMASFRPKEAAVPLLLGLDIFNHSKRPYDKTFSVASMLGRAWKKIQNMKGDTPFKTGEGLAFVFDELNSLDIDTQGALLRFLESSELSALGDFEHKIENVDALIVGVMNEDPYSITKARTLDRVLRDKQIFGGMLGDYLYELFRGQRRLRDDLYFRMARGGEIVLPELRDRREDIPILFYFILTKELMGPLGDKDKDDEKDRDDGENDKNNLNIEIELSTYEQLMDPSLQWEGNVRELQALAREIYKVACDDRDNRRKRGEKKVRLTFRGSHVHLARQKLLSKSKSKLEVTA